MEQSFYVGNRKKLADGIPDGAVVLSFSGSAIRQTADAYYPFFTNRNFVYLTGLSGPATKGFILMMEKTAGAIKETLFILPPDEHAEIWNGKRLRSDEVRAISGIQNMMFLENFTSQFHKLATSGRFESVWMDLNKYVPDEPDDDAHRFARTIAQRYADLDIRNIHPRLRRQRTIKQPCEIEAIREAMKITGAGILAMMKASRPGMYEYEYKAIFDHVLADRRVLTPAFPSIISAGENNFCIHYDAYMGRAQDGDMILNDVGACWDNEVNDVSRGWPCNGRFTEKQRLLYTCAYNTSEYMFSVIRPGMAMQEVDPTARRFCFEQLKSIGLLENFEDIGRYMWHGGAHHIGLDVHDVADSTMPVSPGMVFCVDIGIYCREWGIGFRLEDNCLVTNDGCVNLSAAIPRSIADIEAAMRDR